MAKTKKTPEKLCCFFENRSCAPEKCAAWEDAPEPDEGEEKGEPICRRLTSLEYSAYAIREGLDHLGIAMMGPEAMAGMMNCDCDECKAKRDEAEAAAQKHRDSKMYG